MKVKLYNPKINRPKQTVQDISVSVDVCIIDANNMHGLAFFDFATDKWCFHTDTLVDYNEEGAETEWRWYYPVVETINTKEIHYESEWQSIENMPKDGTIIQRWHKLWNCPITVSQNISKIEGFEWIEQTKTTTWPEESFLPIWKNREETPQIK